MQPLDVALERNKLKPKQMCASFRVQLGEKEQHIAHQIRCLFLALDVSRNQLLEQSLAKYKEVSVLATMVKKKKNKKRLRTNMHQLWLEQ